MRDEVKTLLGIDNEAQDKKIDLVLQMLAEQVKNYCNLDMLPDELRGTLCLMAAEALRGLGNDTGNEKTVTRGDTSVTFFSPAELGGVQGGQVLLERFKPQLCRFRRLRRQ